jgi:predicted N-acetyltransferase YhbS
MADGPRALRDDEWEQLNALESAVFRPEMFQNYPQLFDGRNRENLRVVAEDGKVVSHVGMTERGASLAGCRVDVCCIGAVATYDEYRGRGFASQAFQDCCDKAARDGVDVMLISGGRGLYTRVGCRQVGHDWEVSFTPETVPANLRERRAMPAALTATDIPAMRALHEQEGVRFHRPLDDWRMAFECGVVMNTASDFWGIESAAYVICHQPDKIRRRNPDDPRLVRVVEYAGDRGAVLSALPALLEHYAAGRLTLHVQGTDAAMQAQLRALGVQLAPAGSSGTIRVINFVQLMERCRSLLAERMGADAAAALRFEAEGAPGSAEGGFSIRSGTETVRIPDLATLAEFLFGSPKREAPAIEGSSRLASTLAEALPLPSLWYGINYV